MSKIANPRLIQGVKHALPTFVAKSGSGSHIETECGRKFLDFACGIGVTNLGHCHNGVTEAVQQAAGQIVHCQQNIMRHTPMVNLIDQLSDLEISKNAKLDGYFFYNSGAEAVEASLKLARQATNKPNIIVVNLGYHGRSFGTMPLTTSSTIYRSGFGPFMGGVHVTPFPYASQGPYSMHDIIHTWPTQTSTSHNYWGRAPREIADLDTQRCLEATELLLRTTSAPSETAAILLEPVLGEGGYVPCPPGYLAGLRALCDKYGLLLIADEVQTGFGRTGSMFASDWLDGGVNPDILVMAKGIANGYPLSAIATRSDLAQHQPPGSMGGTYGGNAVGCSAALAVLKAFKEENILENTNRQETVVRKRLDELNAKAPDMIREVRGRGLMIGVDFHKVRPDMPNGATAALVAKKCHEKGLIVLPCGPYDTLRLIPALNITDEDMKNGMDILSDATVEVAKGE